MTLTAERPTGARALDTVAPVLWPGARVAAGRPATGDLAYLALPNRHEPRLLLPATSLAGARSVLAVRGRSPSAAVAAAVVASGVPRLTARRITVRPAGPTLEGLLHALTEEKTAGRNASTLVRLGQPRANLKPVVQVIDGRGQCLAVAKVGVSALTSRLIETEVRALTHLSTVDLRRVVVPGVLHDGTWQGQRLIVQTPLTSAGAAGPPVHDPLLVAAVREIAAASPVVTAPLSRSGYWDRLVRRLRKMHASPTAAALTAAAGRVAGGRAATTRVTFGSWHGDFAAWNCAAAGPNLQVWDWERFEADVPVGFDLLHYALHQELARTARHDEASARHLFATARDLLAPLGVDAAAVPAVAAAYLIDIASRWLADDQVAAGARHADVDRWLVPVLLDVPLS